MSEQLTGVIVGALIASFIPAITLCFEYKRWKKEKLLDYYKNKRERLENLFSEIRKKMIKGMVEESYSVEMIASFLSQCPKNVSEAFDNMMKQENKTQEDYRQHNLTISLEMNESLKEIESKIEKIIS
jgi:hypothetical protein